MDWDDVKGLWAIIRDIPADFKAQVLDIDNPRSLQKGDVIGVHRSHEISLIPYIHYAIYIGDGKIIHYADNEVIESSMGYFLAETTGNSYFLIDFERLNIEIEHDNRKSIIPFVMHSTCVSQTAVYVSRNPYKLFTAEETVNRARSRIGERKYSLMFNNCEHFVMWCKTGVKECNQTADMLKLLNSARIYKTY